jgi:hypothetical protein
MRPNHRDREARLGEREDAVVLGKHHCPSGQLHGQRLALTRDGGHADVLGGIGVLEEPDLELGACTGR